MKNNGIMIITALPHPFLSLHVTGNKHSINGGLKASVELLIDLMWYNQRLQYVAPCTVLTHKLHMQQCLLCIKHGLVYCTAADHRTISDNSSQLTIGKITFYPTYYYK